MRYWIILNRLREGKYRVKRRRRENLMAYLFISPQLLGVLLFTIGPVIFAFLLSFSEWNLVAPLKWVGLKNYEVQLNHPIFKKALFNTAYFAFASIPLGIVLSLGLALALNRKMRGLTWYRSIYFLPVVTPMVAVALVWAWLYNPDFGVINNILLKFGIKGPKWLASTKWAMPSIIFMSVWKGLGYNMVIFLAGLQGIPQHLYEAARIDGATSWKQFRYITLPMLSPATFFVLIMSMIGSFQIFAQSYIMTSGGPANATMVLVLHIYNLAFRYWKMGEASAVAWVLFTIIFIITLIQFAYSKRWVHYYGG